MSVWRTYVGNIGVGRIPAEVGLATAPTDLQYSSHGCGVGTAPVALREETLPNRLASRLLLPRAPLRGFADVPCKGGNIEGRYKEGNGPV